MSDEEFVYKKVPGRLYFSREIAIGDEGRRRSGRYGSRVLSAIDRTHFADIKGELVLRTTPKGREQIKAFFTVDDRKIRTLTLQRFALESGQPRQEAHFTLLEGEIERLLEFVLLVRSADLPGHDKVRLSQSDLEHYSLNKDAARALLRADPRLVEELVEHEITERDIVSIGYRRRMLAVFHRFLEDDAFFESERQRLDCRRIEDVWQRFFEANQWIFGYGLFYVFASAFDESKLEQVVAGSDIGSPGKRADALMRTRGAISSLCFVEIKTHRTDLLASSQRRPGTWAPSTALVEAVAQAQKTVDSAERRLGRRVTPRDADGNPTGEVAFLMRPRSVVVAGNLNEFIADKGINDQKFGSFELYRRQLVAPEIITFDELFQRARLILETSSPTE